MIVQLRVSRGNRGFSLVELMVGLSIGLVLTAIIGTVFSRASKTSTVTQTVNEIEEQARVALDMLQRDIRQAGYIGCNSNRLLSSGGLVTTITTPADYYNNIAQFVQGYEGGAGFTPAAPVELTGAVPAPLTSGDAITVRIPSAEPVALSAPMASALVDVPVFSTADYSVGSRVLISDCSRATAFRVTSLTATTLSHVTGGLNSTADLQRAYGVDALVVPFTTITYYLAASSFGTDLSLWRRVDDAANSEEVAEGVEGFQVNYGLDTDGDVLADQFVAADLVADWSQVVAVRVSLLMRSKLTNAALTTQSYSFNGAAAIAPTDKRLRRDFNITIQLRNRTT